LLIRRDAVLEGLNGIVVLALRRRGQANRQCDNERAYEFIAHDPISAAKPLSEIGYRQDSTTELANSLDLRLS
jgi:hypothetical protein